MHLTTSNNPGAFQKRKPKTLRQYFGQLYWLIKERRFRKAKNYFLSEGRNILFERGIFGKEDKFTCPICGFVGPYFVSLSNELSISWNSACPECNSRSRHRGLFFLYQEVLRENPKAKVLHFAPEPVLSIVISMFPEVEYKTTDYMLVDVDYPGEDIQDLSFKDDSFDLILCNHVIEHVPDDRSALKEMARILRPGGKAIITIPGDWKRHKTVYFKDLRHNGHYRDYGWDVLDLFNSCFSKVEVKKLHDYDRAPSGLSYGISELEPAFINWK